MRRDDLIRQLELQPHPEGGFYREVFRASAGVEPHDGRGQRAALTVIYFLLGRGDTSRWHRVQSDETWHFVEGAPLRLSLQPPDESRIDDILLGPIAGDSAPVRVVPAGWWQSAESTDDYTLVTCCVAPGFEFGDFEMRDVKS